ncbi:MAG: hypothetical protein ABIG35_01265 [Pseudomonadota bacterium]
MQEIKLGCTVIDNVSGLTGIATQIRITLSGCRQIGIQPKGDGTKVLEAVLIDDHLVSVVDEGVSAQVPEGELSTIHLGEKIRDIITKRAGIVVATVSFVNGCLYLEVIPKHKKNDPSRTFFIDHKRAQFMSSGIKANIEKTGKGGPMSAAVPSSSL